MTFPNRKPADYDASEKRSLGHGVFRKCDGCDQTLTSEQLAANFEVCPQCGQHHKLAAARWRELLLDDGKLEEWDAHLEPTDPLEFTDGKTYPDRVAAAQKSARAKEAIEIGRATMNDLPIAYGAFLFGFMGGSMGSVVGEKVARLFERAVDARLPVVLLHASGGARMQEGILSLMQMAKGVAARERLRDARLPFISVLLHPTTGGVAASFALLGDVNLAEPKALIGFAGPRVIESTIRQKLPEGFQRSEFLLAHGMVDCIESRLDMKTVISRLVTHLGPRDFEGAVNLETVLAELYARVPRGMRLSEASLEAMRAACARAGNPERAFEAVHVAGTNGKGSVCAMVESIARAAGRRTGLYTSPHLCRFAERIRVNGEPVTDAALERALAQAIALGPDLSFFETATLAAFVALRDAKVELAVLEVGIGGRLDATNVILPPRAAAITRIAMDHIEMLGGTLEQIAREKAGIAKPGMSIVVGASEGGVRAAIDDVVRAAGAKTHAADGDDVRALLGRVGSLGLRGDHQWENATVAVRLARDLGVDDAAITRGLRDVRWPGRLEWIDAADGAYLLDGAHNPDGAAALARYLRQQTLPFALVFGALADKAWPEMLDLLAPTTPHRVYTEPRGRAAATGRELALRHAGETEGGPREAMATARRLVGPAGIVVVAGSLYLVGEARALLLGLPRDPPVAM